MIPDNCATGTQARPWSAANIEAGPFGYDELLGCPPVPDPQIMAPSPKASFSHHDARHRDRSHRLAHRSPGKRRRPWEFLKGTWALRKRPVDGATTGEPEDQRQAPVPIEKDSQANLFLPRLRTAAAGDPDTPFKWAERAQPSLPGGVPTKLEEAARCPRLLRRERGEVQGLESRRSWVAH